MSIVATRLIDAGQSIRFFFVGTYMYSLDRMVGVGILTVAPMRGCDFDRKWCGERTRKREPQQRDELKRPIITTPKSKLKITLTHKINEMPSPIRITLPNELFVIYIVENFISQGWRDLERTKPQLQISLCVCGE